MLIDSINIHKDVAPSVLTHPRLFSSHLISSRLIRATFSAKHRSSSASTLCVCSNGKSVYASRIPVNAKYIKTSQPTERALPAKNKRAMKTENQPATRALANACKNKQTYSSAWKRLFRALQPLAIDESAGHQSTQMKEIYAIIDTPCLYHFAISRFVLIKHTKG
jgi:hypothetical protein